MHQYLHALTEKLDAYKRRDGLTPLLASVKLAFWQVRWLARTLLFRSKHQDARFHVGVTLVGGMGDVAYAMKYLSCLKRRFEDAIALDVYSLHYSELIELLCGASKVFDGIGTKPECRHDAEITLCRFPVLTFLDRRRLDSVAVTPVREWITTLDTFLVEHAATIGSDYLGRCWSMLKGRTRENQADLDDLLRLKEAACFSTPLPFALVPMLKQFALTENSYIVLQTGGGKHFASHTDTRQWPLEHYKKLAGLLKKAYPQTRLLQLGESFQAEISGVDTSLLGKTTLPEMLAVLAGARLLVSQEGGMAILRHYLCRKPSVVLFGPTDPAFYGFGENANLFAGQCAGCEWISANWHITCLKGSHCHCMAAITPESVMDAIASFMQKETVTPPTTTTDTTP